MDRMIDRRSFIKGLALGAASVAMPAWSQWAEAAVPEKSLSFHSLHTGESLKVTYWAKGGYIADALSEVNWLLRDWRTDQVHSIDPRLLDFLFRVQRQLQSRKAFEVICGYRSPKTNAMLAKRSRGVAKKSLHLQGRAIDVSLQGRNLSEVRRVALKLAAGGVGYYPRSGFVHLDTGRVRFW